ncbi:hypothetical protein L841_0279 [Mycobacterium sp. MAC_080597_8934]|nr:hypothetical protein L841_0279 [Mycobacterium sp. MAC_080597_8934]
MPGYARRAPAERETSFTLGREREANFTFDGKTAKGKQREP